MARFRSRSDMHTVRWYKRQFMIGMISGKEYDITWPVYGFGLLMVYALVQWIK